MALAKHNRSYKHRADPGFYQPKPRKMTPAEKAIHKLQMKKKRKK